MQDDGYPVALNPTKGGSANTLVLAGHDLVVPLERDLDGDPEQVDMVKLYAEEEGYEKVLTSDDEDVEESGDTILLYTFRDVPPGEYSLAVRLGDNWVDVLRGVEVTRDEVWWGDENHEAEHDANEFGTPDMEETDLDEEPEPFFEGMHLGESEET
jgi:hypothetical protein